MIRYWGGKHGVPAESLIVNERFGFTGNHHFFRLFFEARRPIIRIGHVAAPCVGEEIVDQITAAHNLVIVR